MENVFFVNEDHRENFEFMQQSFPISYGDTEYQSACYISSLPMLFNKFKNEIQDYDVPTDWIIKWQMKYLKQDDNETDEEYEERTHIDVTFDLTSSMQHLGKLALNLFNGYEYFNLMDCLSSLDDNNVKVLKSAIDIRLGALKH